MDRGLASAQSLNATLCLFAEGCKVLPEHLGVCPLEECSQCKRAFHAICAGSTEDFEQTGRCGQSQCSIITNAARSAAAAMASQEVRAAVPAIAVSVTSDSSPGLSQRSALSQPRRRRPTLEMLQLPISEIEQLLRDTEDILNNNLADSTRTMYRQHMTRFLEWLFANQRTYGLITPAFMQDLEAAEGRKTPNGLPTAHHLEHILSQKDIIPIDFVRFKAEHFMHWISLC